MKGKFLTLKEVDNVKYLLSKGLKYQEIAEIMKIGNSTISRIAKGVHPLQRSAYRERKLDSLLKELMLG